ncbi:hypothetical protein M2366_000130 [Aeromonas sp. BIGb0405]|jgi:hypothetical protein|nr:hypothetical protein [Aeromonas sp. BIGb0405]
MALEASAVDNGVMLALAVDRKRRGTALSG